MMDVISGIEALRAMEDISKIGGDFTIAFYKYSRKTRSASNSIRTIEKCRVRTRLPSDIFNIDSDNLFLFESNGEPKTCYRLLIRYIGLSGDGYKMKKVNWLK